MSTAAPRLPPVLDGPWQERVAAFRAYTVAHPVLKAVDDALLRAIHEPAGVSILIVVGPTGVGKTTLRQRLVQRVTEAARPALAQDQGRLPIVDLEAAAPDAGHFSWKDYYVRALTALDEPLITHKRVVASAAWTNVGHLLGGRGVVAPELRRALEQALRQRRPVAVVVDEAQHLVKMASGRRLQDQLDHVKSLASVTGTTHVLVGTYELLALRQLSGQLSRRSHILHFPRYTCERAEEVHAFKSVLWSFQRRLPVPQEPDLLRHWEYCYERSIGCVGILKEWLTRALAAALEQGASTLTLAHLQGHALEPAQCLTMATEARAGEQQLAEEPGERARLRRLLGLDTGAEVLRAPDSAGPTRATTRVGQRAPRRDRVGPMGSTSHDR